MLCSGMRKEISLTVRVIFLEKLLGSSDLWGSIFAEDSGVQKSGEIREVQEDDSWASAFSSASHKGEEKYRRIIVSARMTPEHVYTLLGMVISLLILWSQFCSTLFWKTTVRTFLQIPFELGNG